MPSIELPQHVWGRLATVADDRGVSMSDLLTAAVGDVLRPQGRKERILQAVRAGLSDNLVAERTGELRQYVASVRRKAGLPANKQRRTETEANQHKENAA